MRSFDPQIIRLEAIRFAVQKRITQRMLHFAKVDVREVVDAATRDLVYTLQGTVYGKETYSHERIERVPETWWDHFKDEKKWWPKVLSYDKPKWAKLIPWKLCHKLFGHPTYRTIKVDHKHYRICGAHQKDFQGMEERFGGMEVRFADHLRDFYSWEGPDTDADHP